MLEVFRIYGTVELKGADQANKDIDEFNNKGRSASRGLGDFVRGMGKVAAGIGVFALVRKGIDMVKQSMDGAISRYDTLNNFPRVMQQLGFDAESSQGAIDKLSDGIQGLPTRLDEVASTAQSIAVMTGDLDGAVDTTLALNNAFLASGASTADAERGLQQYVQMLSKGEVDLQSWRTLQETMPYALRETAEAFGFTGQSATNDFYEALKSGEISMEEFNAKLIELDQAQGGFAETARKASGGIKTAWTNMQTWVVMGVAKIIEAIDMALGGVGSIEGAINALKPIFDSVFSFVANTIIKTGDVVRSLKDRFDDFTSTISGLKGHFGPLIAIMDREFTRLKSNMEPSLDALKMAWEGLKPVLTVVAQIVGGVLVTAFGVVVSVLTAVMGAIGPLINAFTNLLSFLTNFVGFVVALFTGDLSGAFEHWKNMAESTINFVVSIFEGVIVFFATLVETIVEFFYGLYMTLVGNSIIPDMVNAIVEWFHNLFEWLIEIVESIVEAVVNGFNFMKDLVQNATEMIVDIIKTAWSFIQEYLSIVLDMLVALVTGDFESMLNVTDRLMSAIKTLISNIWGAIDSFLTKTLGNIWTNTKNKFTDMKNEVQTKVTEAKDQVVEKFTSIKNNIVNKLTEAKNNLTTKFTEMVSTASNKANEILSAIITVFSGILSTIVEYLTNAVILVGQFIGQMPGKVIEFTSQMMSAGMGLVQGLISGIKNMGKQAIDAITGVVDGVVNKAKSLLKINSPSLLFKQFGGWLSEGLAIGIDDESKQAIESADGLASGLSATVRKGIKEMSLDSMVNVNPISSYAASDGIIGAVGRNVTNIANKVDDRLLQATLEQNKLLMQLLKKDPNIIINKRDMVDVVNEENALDNIGAIFD